MAKNNKKLTGSAATVVLKKPGARNGLNPGTGGTGVGLLPYGAQTGGQAYSDPVKNLQAMQKKNRRVIGLNEH